MTTRSNLPDPAIRALAWLLDLAARRAGYTVHGQPGWAGADEVSAGVSGWGTSEMLRAQARRGRVHEFDARAPGERRPRWVYRISQEGADALAQALGVAAASVGDPRLPGETRVLLRDTTRHALDALRAAAGPAASPGREWVPGEVGWRSSRELTETMARENEKEGSPPGYRWFTHEDLGWLVQHGLVESRVLGKTHVYRITGPGADVRALEWSEPRDG
jgi:hypothetical protein